MSILKKARINKVSMDLSNYYYLIQGVHKSGKTTFARDFILQTYGDASKGLLLAIGKEKGYKALDDINVVDIESWADFESVTKELIETKKEHGIKCVFIDVYDELIPLAEKEVMRLSTIHTKKVCKSFNSAFGGYGQPRTELRKLINEKLELLNKHFGLFVLGHTKLKNIKEQGATEEQEYQKLSSNLNNDYHNVVAHKADIIGTIVVEKDITDKKISNSKPVMYFRDNGFIEAGSRFENIVDKIDFNAENFIRAIKDAIKNSSKYNDITDDELEIMATKEKDEREKILDDEIIKDIKKIEDNTQCENSIEYEDDIEDEDDFEAIDKSTNGVVCDKEKNSKLLKEITSIYPDTTKETKKDIKNILDSFGYKKFDIDAPTEMFEKAIEILRQVEQV